MNMPKKLMTPYGAWKFDLTQKREYNGKTFYAWGTHAGKSSAQERAEYVRNKRDMKARVAKTSHGYTVYVGKK